MMSLFRVVLLRRGQVERWGRSAGPRSNTVAPDLARIGRRDANRGFPSCAGFCPGNVPDEFLRVS